MRAVQRLFGNDYTERAGLDAYMSRGDAQYRRGVPGLAFASLLLVTGLALLLPVATALPPISAGPSYAAYDTGGLHIVLPSALPHIDLTQDANASVGASLILDRLVEVNASGANAHSPQIVAAALATEVRSFNASSAGAPGVLVGLTANLTVYKSSGPLFPPAGSARPIAPQSAIAPTTLTVLLRSGPAGEVGISTSIVGWPWVAPDDVLAVGWQFSVTDASSFAGCAQAASTGVPAAACGADPFAAGNASWHTGWTALEGLTVAGPQAQLGWPSFANSSNGPVPTLSGAERTAPGSAEVVQGAPAKDASSVEYSLSYALALPPTLNTLLHGSLWPYLGGGLSAAALAAGAVVYVRRRDRQLLDDL